MAQWWHVKRTRSVLLQVTMYRLLHLLIGIVCCCLTLFVLVVWVCALVHEKFPNLKGAILSSNEEQVVAELVHLRRRNG